MHISTAFTDAHVQLHSQMHNFNCIHRCTNTTAFTDAHLQLHSQMHICICIHKCINPGYMNTFIVNFTVKFLTSHHTGKSGNKQDTWTYSTSTSQWSSISDLCTDAQIELHLQMHNNSCIHRCTFTTAYSDAQLKCMHKCTHMTAFTDAQFSCIHRCTNSAAILDAQCWLQSQMHNADCIHRCTFTTAFNDAQIQLHTQMHN
jgi:hypothetical protein